MTRSARTAAFSAALVCAAATTAPAPTAVPEEYRALRSGRVSGRSIAVGGLTLERDVFRFTFREGEFHLLEAEPQRVFGAVFVGDGRYTLQPATGNELHHLRVVTRSPTLTALEDSFESAVLLFTDETAAALGTPATAAAAATARAQSVYERHLQRQRTAYRANVHLRLLQDRLDGPRPHKGVFLAFVEGARHGEALAAHDPLGVEALRVVGGLGGEETALVKPGRDGGVWYSSRRKDQARLGEGAAARRVADALDYRVETRIGADQAIEGTALLRFQTRMAGVRVVPLDLFPHLRVRAAALVPPAGEAVPLAFVQEAAAEDADTAVILPAPQPEGATLTVRIDYAGRDVLSDAGDGNFTVAARTNWYPNLGAFDDLATFELTYVVPRDREVVSVGRLASDEVQGAVRRSTWKAERPVRVAGFNYGRFKKLERMDAEAGVRLQVYTNPGTPDMIAELNQILQAMAGGIQVGSPIPSAAMDGVDVQVPSWIGPRQIHVTTESLAEAALVDASNMARVGNAYFGRLAPDQVAITQQSQWHFGQSWPGLIYLPYLAFVDGTTRAQLGLTGATAFVDQVGAHEFAHQWWGHAVGFESYRDQWLSEGFSEFAAALLMQHARGGAAYDAFWETVRKRILGRPAAGAAANHEVGPITQGWRLASAANPQAYAANVYGKGAYVLHMLRMMMLDTSAAQPEAAFRALIQDFARTYTGAEASTADFQAIVEKHMVPAMNATRDGRMDWFFGQWVHGTEIPRYRQQLKLSAAGKDTWRIQGTVSQEEVSAEFRALLPLYVEFDKGGLHRVGVLPFVGPATREIDVQVTLPKKPKRALFNARHDVLAKD